MLDPSEGKSVASFAETVFTCTIILLMSTLCFSPMESSLILQEVAGHSNFRYFSYKVTVSV